MEIFSRICRASFLLSQFFFVGSTQILMEQKRKTVRVTPWHNISSQEVFSALCTAIAYFCLPDEALPTRWCSEIHSFGDRQKIFSRLRIPWTHLRWNTPCTTSEQGCESVCCLHGDEGLHLSASPWFTLPPNVNWDLTGKQRKCLKLKVGVW